MSKAGRYLIGMLAALLLQVTGLWGEDRKPPSFDPAITRVAVFKNGYVFTYREGESRLYQGECSTSAVPTGVLGTVWGYSLTPKVNVTHLFASETEEEQMTKVESLYELLIQNEGGRVRVKTHDKDEYEGQLTVLTSRPQPLPPYEAVPVAPSLLTMPGPSFDIAVRTDTGTVIMNYSQISRVQLLSDPRWEKPVKTRRRQLTLNTEGDASGQNVRLGVAALERGIRWIPGYRIELKGEKVREAKLELEASIVNDLIDLKDTDFYFVVGVPHFLLKDAISPLSLRSAFTGLSAFFNEPQGTYDRAVMSQAALRASDGGMPGMAGPSEPMPTVLEEERLPALSVEELFLYQAKSLSLKKGSRASLRLFSATVPCSEVFEWTILDPPGQSSYQPPQPRERLMLEALTERVWYALKLKNNTGMPWTTGPAMSFREWKPLGQDMMPFTAVGGEAIVKVTPATEVVGEHVQQEIERKAGAANFFGYAWDLVTVEGTIKLRNVKKEPVEVVITRRTEGEATQASDKGEISREGLQLQAVNPNAIIRWQITLPPGEKQLRYTYMRYVRRS